MCPRHETPSGARARFKIFWLTCFIRESEGSAPLPLMEMLSRSALGMHVARRKLSARYHSCSFALIRGLKAFAKVGLPHPLARDSGLQKRFQEKAHSSHSLFHQAFFSSTTSSSSKSSSLRPRKPLARVPTRPATARAEDAVGTGGVGLAGCATFAGGATTAEGGSADAGCAATAGWTAMDGCIARCRDGRNTAIPRPPFSGAGSTVITAPALASA
jgi:hypothetical protein